MHRMDNNPKPVKPGESEMILSSDESELEEMHNLSPKVIVNASFMDANWHQGNTPPLKVPRNNSRAKNASESFPALPRRMSARNKMQVDDAGLNASFSAAMNGASPANLEEIRNRPQGEDKVMIIEPSGSSNDIKAFFNNDLLIANALEDPHIKLLDITDVRKNMSRKILIIKHKPQNQEVLRKALEVTKLGEFSVKCRLPVIDTRSYGVIGPIGQQVKAEGLLQELSSGYKTVEKVERIKKGKEKVDTMFLKVTFSQSNLLEYVYIGYQRYAVKEFVQTTPWQCYKCQGFGHNAMQCRYKPRCLVCGKSHEYKDCPHKGSKMENPTCPNCGGKHAGNFGGCPAFKKAKKVEQLRSTQKLSYRDALKVINQEEKKQPKDNNNSNNPQPQQGSSDEGSQSNQNSTPVIQKNRENQAVVTVHSQGQQPINKKTSNIAVQTEEVTQCNCHKDPPFDTKAFLKEIAQLVHQVLANHVKSLTESAVSQLVEDRFEKATEKSQNNNNQEQPSTSKEMKSKKAGNSNNSITSKTAINMTNNSIPRNKKTGKRKDRSKSPKASGSGLSPPSKLSLNGR